MRQYRISCLAASWRHDDYESIVALQRRNARNGSKEFSRFANPESIIVSLRRRDTTISNRSLHCEEETILRYLLVAPIPNELSRCLHCEGAAIPFQSIVASISTIMNESLPCEGAPRRSNDPFSVESPGAPICMSRCAVHYTEVLNQVLHCEGETSQLDLSLHHDVFATR